MNLYMIKFDNQSYFVEAPTFPEAIKLWEKHVSKEWGPDYDGTEQPESVELIHDEPVIRAGAI